MKTTRPGRLTTAALSLAALATQPALAQDGTGIRGNLSFSTGLEVSDNPSLTVTKPGTTITSVTDLGFSISSETRVDQFRLSLGATIEGEDGGDSTAADALDITRSNVALSYARSGINSNLSFSGRVSDANLDDEVFGLFIDGVFDPDALIVEGGTRKRTALSLDFETGLNAPFGLSVSLDSVENDFVDTADPDLNDNELTSVGARARFNINPALTGRLTGLIRETETDDLADTSRRVTSFGAGVTTETRNGLEIAADVTLDSTETLNGGVLASEDDGIGLQFGITQDQPDGELGLNVASRLDESGRRNSARVRREFELPNGSLGLSLGLVDQENQDLELTTALSYVRESADGSQLSANVVQTPTTDDGLALLNTSIEFGYTAPIDTVSSWGADFSYGTATEFGNSSGDSRTTAGVRYSRSLTRDWGLNAGLRLDRVNDDSGPDRSSGTVFVNVGRDFSFGF